MAYKRQSVPLKFRRKQFVKKWKKYSRFFYIAFSIFVIVSIGFLGLKVTFLSPQNKVKNIIFNPQNIDYFDEQSLYNAISSGLQNKNIYSLKADGKNFLSSIQKSYPILKNIDFQNSGENTYVDLKFFNPTLIFNHQGSYVGVYNGYFFPLSNDSQFLSGRTSIILPRYVDFLTGSAFYEVSEQQLKYQMERIVSSFSPVKIIYLLGGNKTIIQNAQGQYIIFDNFARSADINVQIEKYGLFLANNTLPQKDIKIIDLGSMDDSVIVSTGNYFGTGLDFSDFDIKPSDIDQDFSGDSVSSEVFSGNILSGKNLESDGKNNILSGENFSSQKSSSSKLSTTDRA